MRRRLPFGCLRVVAAKMVSMSYRRARLSASPGGGDPERVALHPFRIVIHDDGLPLAVDVERFSARLAEAVAGVLDAAERHVRPGAVGRTVDRDEAGAVARDEL